MRFVLPFVCACSEFDPPSALSHPQIIAVRATPAALEPGGQATLDALVAGPDGVLAPVLAWRILAAPEGTVLDGASLTAGATGDVVLALEADGLAAEKRITIAMQRDNPVVALTADGVPVDELRVVRGATVALAADAPALSWYSTLGEITLFRAPATELEVPEPGEGTLIVVGRDGEGGVGWKIVKLVVD